jgi:hypothetical protein
MSFVLQNNPTQNHFLFTPNASLRLSPALREEQGMGACYIPTYPDVCSSSIFKLFAIDMDSLFTYKASIVCDLNL